MHKVRATYYSLKRALLKTAEFPENSVRGVPDIDIRGGRDCYVTGCNRIVEYTQNKIVFGAGTVCVEICGSELTVMSYGAGCLCASGKIASVNIAEDES